jgi:hypothetical protein
VPGADAPSLDGDGQGGGWQRDGGGDGGNPIYACYPPCLADPIWECFPNGSCIADPSVSTYPQTRCYSNGVRIVVTQSQDETFFTTSKNGVPCFTQRRSRTVSSWYAPDSRLIAVATSFPSGSTVQGRVDCDGASYLITQAVSDACFKALLPLLPITCDSGSCP